MSIGERLKAAREKAGITQRQLAEKIGVTQKDICRWEKGERTPSLIRFSELCKSLDVSADKILNI